MRKNTLKVMTVLLAGSMMCSSCMIGSFGLFNKYREWQTHMTSSKFVNAIVGYVLGAICYPVTLFVDSLVLNTIEFWSGKNPVASSVGKTQMIQGKDGKMYAVTTLKDGYEIKAANGEVTMLTYIKKDNAWTMTQNGQTQELFRFNEDGTIRVEMNGTQHDFTLDDKGVMEAQNAAFESRFYAIR
jgi:hypothetical protein